MDEMTRVRVLVSVSVVVLVSSALMIVFFEGFNLWTAVMFLTVAAIAAIALAVVLRALKDVKNGIPLQDERSKALGGRTAFISFYLSMYLTLALAVAFIALEDRGVELSNSEVLFILVAMMGSIHLAVSGYCNRKGSKAVR